MVTDLSNTPSLISYLKENFNLENFNYFIQSAKNKLRKYNKSGWTENFNKSFEVHRNQTLESIERGQYLFSPFKLKMVPTKINKIRRVSVVNINDAFLDRLIFNYINGLSQSPHYNSVHSISINIKQNIKKGKSYFLRVDIENFFESLNHSFILDIIKSYGDKNLTEVINSFLVTPWIWEDKSEDEIFCVGGKNELGVPPGSAISQGLSDIYLRAFDKSILEYAKNKGDVYYRYTDDICYLSTDREKIIKVKERVEKELSKVKLKINVSKLSYGNIEEEFDYLGFNHSKQGIRLSNDSLNYIKNKFILIYKSVHPKKSAYPSTKCFDACSTNFREGFNFWRILSLRINSAIRGYTNLWNNSESYKETVYGLARYICIVDDFRQIKIMDKWLRKLNKYYCYKICEDAQYPKTFVELDSLYNWFWRYKKNPNSAIKLAYKRYKSIYYDESKEKNENDFVRILGHDYIVVDGLYYDNEDKILFKIPDGFNLS